MSDEFITGLVTGVLATTLGFGLTMAWDLWKISREQKQKSNAILRAIKHELIENQEIAKDNKELLEAEIPVLKEGKHLVAATLPFKKEIWDLLKINLPDKILSNEGLIEKLSSITMASAHLNEGMASRQIYRDTSANNTAFSQNMKGRNSMLIAQIDELSKNIETLINDLNNLNKQWN